MGIFNSKNEKPSQEYCLIGLNRFNKEIGLILLKEGHKVTVIDIDPKKINNLGGQFTEAVVCDCTNLNDLSDLGIQHFDYVILGITDMETSVVTASNLKELEVQKIMCKAKDEKHRRILKFLGIDVCFIPEEEVAVKVAYKAMHDLNVDTFSFDDSNKDTLIINVPALNSKIWDKKISELEELKPMAAIMISIKKQNGQVIMPVGGESIIEEGDIVCILCHKNNLKKVKQLFSNS